jgi:hypothetical protein
MAFPPSPAVVMKQHPPEPHPPKPRLTLRVGVTGHRPNKLSSEQIPRITEQLREVMAAIDRVVESIYRTNAQFYSAAPQIERPPTEKPYRIRLVSGLAEGADQIAVTSAAADWTVEAILPFPRDEYRKDFETSAAGDGRNVTGALDASLQRAQAVMELPAPRPDRRNQGYVTAGGYLLRQVDLLIAVWDGEEPKPGGTGAIVQEAHDGGIPVVWISTDGKVRFIERFEDETPLPSAQDWSDQALKAALEPVLAAPSPQGKGRQRSPRSGLDQFYKETWHRICGAPIFDLLKRLTNRQAPRALIRCEAYDAFVANFNKLVDDAPDVEPLKRRLKEIVAVRYTWADALAVHYSHWYRSAYVLAYLLSAIAVLIALLGIFAKTIDQKAYLVLAELAVIFFIIMIVRTGRRRHWHERWIEYRLIAEGLRHARFLAYLSEFGGIHQRAFGVQPWTIWYLRATLREIGLPNTVLDEKYQKPLLEATRKYEVSEQLAWHRSNAIAMHRVDHFLHRLGNICFVLTAWILAAYALTYFLLLPVSGYLNFSWINQFLSAQSLGEGIHAVLYESKSAIIILAAGLPTFGAASAAIRAQGDFEGSRGRSQSMDVELTALLRDYEAAIDNPRLDRTADMLIETARVMSEDLAAWQELYGRKRLVLPA